MPCALSKKKRKENKVVCSKPIKFTDFLTPETEWSIQVIKTYVKVCKFSLLPEWYSRKSLVLNLVYPFLSSCLNYD